MSSSSALDAFLEFKSVSDSSRSCAFLTWASSAVRCATCFCASSTCPYDRRALADFGSTSRGRQVWTAVMPVGWSDNLTALVACDDIMCIIRCHAEEVVDKPVRATVALIAKARQPNAKSQILATRTSAAEQVAWCSVSCCCFFSSCSLSCVSSALAEESVAFEALRSTWTSLTASSFSSYENVRRLLLRLGEWSA